jgi:hypothetical protein
MRARGGKCVQILDARPEEGGHDQVILRAPLEVLAAREAEDIIVITRAAQVLGIPVIVDPSIHRCELATDGLGAIARGIVGDHELEISEGLIKDGSDAALQQRLAVVDGHAECNRWYRAPIHRASSPP